MTPRTSSEMPEDCYDDHFPYFLFLFFVNGVHEARDGTQ